MSEGFEVICDGILERPLRIARLFAAVAVAAQLGRDTGGEIRIFDVGGDVVEVLPLPDAVPQQALRTLAA